MTRPLQGRGRVLQGHRELHRPDVGAHRKVLLKTGTEGYVGVNWPE